MSEYVTAVGYVGITALALRGLDLLTQWRRNQRTGNISDLELVRKYQADALLAVRQQLEDERRENIALSTKLDIAEKSLLELKAVHAQTDSALKDVEAELRLIRKDAMDADARRDTENDRHTDETNRERGRRSPRSRLKP
jgi:hypothetical protein